MQRQMHTKIDNQTDTHTKREEHILRETDRQLNKQTHFTQRRTHTKTDNRTDRQKDRQTHTHTRKNTKINRQIYRQTNTFYTKTTASALTVHIV